MAGNYWDNYWRERRSRRRFLGGAVAAGAGASALALVGCGDDDDDNGGSSGLATATSGAAATATPADPFAAAKRGGSFKDSITNDPPSLDPYGSANFLTKSTASFVYSRLMKYNAGPGVTKDKLAPTPDLAEKVESTPDGLVWTFHLRKDAKMSAVAPLNGRPVTSADVKFSIERATDPKAPSVGLISGGAGLDKVEYPDDNTVKMTLKSPNAAWLDIMADANGLWIMPKEAGNGGYDPTKTMMGSGPWILDNYTTAVSVKYKKNPDWYGGGNAKLPLMDSVEFAIIPDYANSLAQFQAGNLDHLGIRAEDLVNTKKTVPNVQYYGEISQLLSMFYFDSDPNSPWAKSDLVRKAISMCLDRDAITDLGYNIKALKAAGLNVAGPWNNIIPAGMTRWWLDPQSSDMGENAKFFKYDVAEAKKMLSAAGFPNGFETTYKYPGNNYGATFNAIGEANIQFLNAIGIKTTTDVQDYTSKYFPQTFSKGNFKGIAFGYETPFPEVGSYFTRQFGKDTVNHGAFYTDPKITDFGTKQQGELDPVKRKAIIWDYQRYQASQMYYVPNQAGAGTGWEAFQDWIKNVDAQTVPGSYAVGAEEYPFRWSSKA
jgi:peptide/nickel transport system substrate-binding protein